MTFSHCCVRAHSLKIVDDNTLFVHLHVLLGCLPDGDNFRVAKDVCLDARYKTDTLKILYSELAKVQGTFQWPFEPFGV